MNVLVTGGAGFIGSHLVEGLVEQGHQVTVLDDLSTGRLENLAAVRSAVRFVKGSVTEYTDVWSAMRGCELVYHEAAIASVPRSVENPRQSHAVNVGGTVNVLEAARRLAVRRVVFAGSAAIYGNREGAVVEHDAPAPQSPYAIEKLASEHYLQVWPGLYGVETVTLRYFNVFGPRQDPSSPYSGVVSIFAERLKKGLPVTLYGDGAQTRDFVAVADVVEANLRAGTVAGVSGQAFNVARGAATSINDLYAALARPFGAPAPVYAEARAGDVRHSRADVSKAADLLGFRAKLTVSEGLERLLAWLG
jgi:UDP-glucose 4-epimerase